MAGETGAGWASEVLDNLKQASDEALEIFYSAFNVSGAGAGASAPASDGVGWGSVNAEGEGRKQFFFGDPSDYDLSDINGQRSQVRAQPSPRAARPDGSRGETARPDGSRPRRSPPRACARARACDRGGRSPPRPAETLHRGGVPDVRTPRLAQWALFKSNTKGFLQAIEWTEPWLIGLACFHVVLLVTAVRPRLRPGTHATRTRALVSASGYATHAHACMHMRACACVRAVRACSAPACAQHAHPSITFARWPSRGLTRNLGVPLRRWQRDITTPYKWGSS